MKGNLVLNITGRVKAPSRRVKYIANAWRDVQLSVSCQETRIMSQCSKNDTDVEYLMRSEEDMFKHPEQPRVQAPTSRGGGCANAQSEENVCVSANHHAPGNAE